MPRAVAFCAALILVTASLHGQTAIPDTPAGRVLGAWLDAYNSGDTTRVRAFLRTYLVEGNLHGSFAFRRMTGGFDLLSVEMGQPRHIEFSIPARNSPLVGYSQDTVAGRRFGGGKPVYVLTSAYTVSAGEALAYTLQALARATIVGETTAGEAHPTFQVSMGDHFVLRLPAGRVVNAVTRTDWEGVGVLPDVKVPASEALAAVQTLLRDKMPQ